jgi:hypothetical protein
MACAVLPLSARASPNVRSSFPTLLVPAEGTCTVVDLRRDAKFSAAAAGQAVIEAVGPELIDTANVRALAVRQRMLDSRGRQLTVPSRSRLAVRVLLHRFGLTEVFEARARVQL